jgi:methionyl-tRNA formyltransferase
MGTPQFAIPSLDNIFHSDHKIAGIVTQPDRPSGRGQKLLPTPVKKFAFNHQIEPIFQPILLKDEHFINDLRKLRADLFVVVAFRILPEAIFEMAPKGTINLHPSLLPKYRGAAPINWAIINGERITGVTIIYIKKEIDAGNIILQEEEPIHEADTVGSLHDRLSQIGADLLIKAIDQIARNKVQTYSQNPESVTKAPKVTSDIAHLNFNQPASNVKNWIHGLSPIPGAFGIHNRRQIKFYCASIVDETYKNASPGKVYRVSKNQLWITCNPGIISILELQQEGKRKLTIEEFLRGYKIIENDTIE